MRGGRGAVRDDAEVKSMLLILDSGNGFVLVACCNCVVLLLVDVFMYV